MTDLHKKLNTETQELRLSASEKAAMRASLHAAIGARDFVPSPYGRFFSMRAAAGGLLAVFLVATTTAYAAQGALPGDPLYPVKVSVTEPVIGALQVSPRAKAGYETALVEKRVTEAETLAAEGRLTPGSVAQIENNLDVHAAAALQAADQSDDGSGVVAVSTEIGASLAAHETILARVASTTNGDRSAAAFAAHIAAASRMLLSESTSTPATPASTTAATSTRAASSTPASMRSSAHTETHSRSPERLDDWSALRAEAVADLQSAQLQLSGSGLDPDTTAFVREKLDTAHDDILKADEESATGTAAYSTYRNAVVSAATVRALLSARKLPGASAWFLGGTTTATSTVSAPRSKKSKE